LLGLLYVVLGRRKKAMIALAMLGYVLVLATLTGVLDLPEESAVGRIAGGSSAAAADQQRQEGLEANLRAITDAPVFGQGFTLPDRAVDVYFYVHDAYLQAWIASGFLGGLVTMLLGATMLALPFGQPPRSLALACGVAAIALAWIGTNIFLTRDQWIFMALAFRMTASPFARATAPRVPE